MHFWHTKRNLYRKIPTLHFGIARLECGRGTVRDIDLKGLLLKAAISCKITLAIICCVFFCGCFGSEEVAERLWSEGKPYTNQFPEAYGRVDLKESSSADVLSFIKREKPDVELLSQSESVIASFGEKKQTKQFWLNMVAFDEEEFTATRKYFLAVDEKPWHLFAEGQKMRFDTEMVFSEEQLTEPHSNENARLVAILEQILETTRSDIVQVRQDSRVLDAAAMMINQTLERLRYILDKSPARAAWLERRDGLEFDHPTLGWGKVRMVFDEDIVKLKIKIGRVARNFGKQKDVMAMLWSEDIAIELAEQRAWLRRIPLRKYTSHYDEDNVRWNKRSEELEAIRPLELDELLGKLGDGRLVTVHYKPIPPYKGPDLWVFIDAKTANTITSYKDER